MNGLTPDITEATVIRCRVLHHLGRDALHERIYPGGWPDQDVRA
jgi:hypothetical protein